MTKSVRSVWFSATARKSSAFSSARIRKDIRLLSSTAILGMAATPPQLCTHSNSTSKTDGGQLFVCIDYVHDQQGLSVKLLDKWAARRSREPTPGSSSLPSSFLPRS